MPDGIKVAVFVEDIEEAGAWNASAIGYRAEIHVPQMTMDKLPEDLHNFEILSEEGKVAYQLLLNHFLHEVLHMFGAFHSDSGIMSGVIQLFDRSDNGFQLINALDDITAKIVSETLLDEIFNKSPSVIMSFDRESNSLYLSSDIEIVLVVFLKQTRYTKKFFYCYTSEFHCTAPGKSEWDAVFVQFLYGASIYYTQSSIYNNRVFDRFRGR
ncbi:hypothetical protein CAEBREN_25099 [Caenorhabditis brenneri]|uniref:Uncharacterized protein n=1 Tax=Caenorhabditis brenneri TaxID=135651 RepID=G0M740_CAEBE|nr:hypothetical protein CAEBREN_25099 [Caenorhabditis brenneri]